jgi:excisionase family DNA binding protein
MTTDDTDDKPLLTVEEAARRLGIGRTTMYGLVSSGDVESITLDRRLRRVPAECLDEYIAAQRRKQTHSKQSTMGAA